MALRASRAAAYGSAARPGDALSWLVELDRARQCWAR